MKTIKLKIVCEDDLDPRITLVHNSAEIKWFDGESNVAIVAIYAIPDDITFFQVLKAFENTTDLTWIKEKEGRTEFYWEELGTVIRNPFPIMYMNKETGSVGPYKCWYFNKDKFGNMQNYVDLGEVVEVEYRDDCWVEV